MTVMMVTSQVNSNSLLSVQLKENFISWWIIKNNFDERALCDFGDITQKFKELSDIASTNPLLTIYLFM